MIKTNLPVLILKGVILFPNSEIRLEIDTDKDKKLISLCESYYDKHILVVNQRDPLEESPDILELPKVGVIGLIIMKLDLPNGKTRIVIRGIKRTIINEYQTEDNTISSVLKDDETEEIDELEEQAYARILSKQLEIFVESVPYMGNSILSQISGITNINKLTDIITLYLNLNYERKLELLEEYNPVVRVRMLLDDINRELKIIELERSLEEQVSKDLDKAQKEFILKEKIKAIKEELGEISDKDTDVLSLREKIDELECPKKIKDRLYLEINKYETSSITSPDSGIIRNYIDCLLSLPWKKRTKDNTNLIEAKRVLDNSHYGLEKIKDRIIEFLALRNYTKNSNSPIICFVGPPGVGKTTLAKSIASAVNRKWTKISVGGINDEAEIMGHRRTYIGAAPGRIIQGMKKVGTNNPVFIIDEIDKMTKDIKGDPASALLEVLDKEQNNAFSDNYIEEEFDLSNVMFICTANYIEQIPLELYDRLEIIELPSYTEYEKLNIARDYLIPKEIINHGLKDNNVIMSDEAILKIIRNYTKEAGVRELSRNIESILRKIVVEIVNNDKKRTNFVVEEKTISKYLGIEKYEYNKNLNINKVGVVNGLVYSSCGGDISAMEVISYPGKGDILMTGQLGDVFIESIKIALSYVKSNALNLKIDIKKLNNIDIHVHVPEGAIKKDGPSAGITLTTAIIGMLLNKSISNKIAMTGEMTLTGDILPIGGLKEKIIGAKRANIEMIYLPFDNKKDLDDIENYIKEGIDFILVKNYHELEEKLFDIKNE